MWAAVCQSKLGMVTLPVLLVYIAIALIDSIHFKPVGTTQVNNNASYQFNRIHSLLDKILAPRGQLSEKSYSAPFATHGLNKKTIKNQKGQIERIYMPLKHIKKLPVSKASKALNIALIILMGFMKAIILISALLILWVCWYAYRYNQNTLKHFQHFVEGQYRTAWRSFWLMTAIMISLVIILYDLSDYFYVFGTDKVGDGVFYGAVKSIRTAVIIGTLTTLIMLPLAILLGLAAGYFGGVIDDMIQYVYTTLNAIPGVLLIVAFTFMLNVYMSTHAEWFDTVKERADYRLLGLCLILGITSWTSLCRLLRAETLKIKSLDYIKASQAMGSSSMKTILKHILPNVFYLVVITVVLDFSGLVLTESILSYIGVGVDPSMYSWGNMINSARADLGREPVVWWPLMAAFIFMFVLVLCVNLFSDVIRDAMDPRLRNT